MKLKVKLCQAWKSRKKKKSANQLDLGENVAKKNERRNMAAFMALTVLRTLYKIIVDDVT